MKRIILTALITALGYLVNAQNLRETETEKPSAVVNLANDEAIKIVRGQWKYSDAKILESKFHSPGKDKKPSGPENITHDISPKAGAIGFDDSAWEVISPSSLEDRRGNGRISFNWYRLKFTLPAKAGNFPVNGSTVYFEIVVDDYAEVWVNGVLNKSIGQKNGAVIGGYNSRNRVKLTDRAVPGQTFQLAIFGINGPLSDIPDNYIWIRSATLDFYEAPLQSVSYKVMEDAIQVISPELEEIVSSETKLERIADGFDFTEGPVWSPEGFLLFSDPNRNVIYRYTKDGDVSVYRTKSGYAGTDIGEYHQPGSNGLTYDPQGRLIVCEHGNHRISRIEKNGVVSVLADAYQGRRLNSPNDLVYRSDGSLYFTDPPYGLPEFFNDRRKELGFSGVYCYRNDSLRLAASDLKGPNGIAFSPDEKYAYVSNWDITDIHHTKVIMKYEVGSDGTLVNGNIFYDGNSIQNDLAFDGLKVDLKGNVYSSAPDAIYIINSDGKLIGKIITPEHASNMSFGEKDGKTLFITAGSAVYRLRLNIGGKLTAMN
jgi:gluconolactonase